MSGSTLSFAAGQVFVGSSTIGTNTGEVAFTQQGNVTFSMLTPPTITNVTITQDIAASSTSTPFSTPLGVVDVTFDSVTIESVDTAAHVVLTTNDLPPGITIPPGFTLPQTVDGTTLHVSVATNVGSFTGDVGVYGMSGTLALVAVQDLVAYGATFDVGAAVLSLGPQTTGVVSNSFTPSFSQATPCFAAGTRIATVEGPVPVESLAAGDIVRLADGGTAPVRWVGQRVVACDRHPRPQDVLPIRIAAGAIAEGVPARDVLLSPDHAVALDGALVPARYLVNGATIRQEPCARVHYFHVELDSHALLLVEGMAAESYLDTGNRAAFVNGGAAIALHPDFASIAARAVWQARGCLPLLIEGPGLAGRRAALLARAVALGWRETTVPALRVLLDGRPTALAWQGTTARLAVPAGTQQVTVLSRRFVPAEHQPAGGGDSRVLGAALAVDLDARGLVGAAFGEGWYAAEQGAAWRWTDGAAHLLPPPGGGAMLLRLMAAGARYWLAPRAGRQATGA